jgi:hypothetical protein
VLVRARGAFSQRRAGRSTIQPIVPLGGLLVPLGTRERHHKDEEVQAKTELPKGTDSSGADQAASRTEALGPIRVKTKRRLDSSVERWGRLIIGGVSPAAWCFG